MENLKEILEILMTVVIIPSIPVLAKYAVDALKEWANEKALETDNKMVAKYINEITDTVSQAVICTTQTYVDTLKAQGKFDAEAQKIAFNKTKEKVMSLLAQDAIDFLNDMFGDADLWLNTKIEQKVKESNIF